MASTRTAARPKKTTAKKAPRAPAAPSRSHSAAQVLRAPPFDLESDQGKRVRSADLAGKWHVVYFYPRDSTPGCTREATGFTAALPALKKLGAQVFGVSKDSIASHCTFRDRYALAFPLLSDPDLEVHKAFGAWGKKTMYGREVEGTIRSPFLVAPDASIARASNALKAAALLRAHRELPQAGWLMAEVERARAVRWLRVRPVDADAAARAWRRADALDGGRQPSVAEQGLDGRAPEASVDVVAPVDAQE